MTPILIGFFIRFKCSISLHWTYLIKRKCRFFSMTNTIKMMRMLLELWVPKTRVHPLLLTLSNINLVHLWFTLNKSYEHKKRDNPFGSPSISKWVLTDSNRWLLPCQSRIVPFFQLLNDSHTLYIVPLQ